MNGRQIARVLSKDIRSRRIFRGVYARDLLNCSNQTFCRGPSVYVVNTDSSDKPGEHWVALYFNGLGQCEYFDSFGLPPRHLDIKMFIYKHCRKFCYNKRMIQPLTSDTCGYYVIYYILMKSRGLSLIRAMIHFNSHQP